MGLILFFSPVIIFAQDTLTASDSTMTVPQYVRNLYVLGLALIGIVAFGRLVFAGYQYMFGGANANMISSAKTAFWDVAAGIAVLVCGLLLLRTINPDILNFRWSVLSIDLQFIKDKLGEQQNQKNAFYYSSEAECKINCELKGGECKYLKDMNKYMCVGTNEGQECTVDTVEKDCGEGFLCKSGICINDPHYSPERGLGEICNIGDDPFLWDGLCESGACGSPNSKGERKCVNNTGDPSPE